MPADCNYIDRTERRYVELRRDTGMSVNAYPPEGNMTDWKFQLSFNGGGTLVSFSGIGRENFEAVRDAMNAVVSTEGPGR